MPKHRDQGPPEYTPSSDDERVLLARYAISLSNWRWFPGCEIVRKRDEQALIPPLLFGLYIARKQNKKITKGEACDLMGVDRATTGPKFIKALADDDLISLDTYPEIDKRKDFLTPTLKLERLVEGELLRLARNLKHFAENLSTLEMVAGIDMDDVTRIPPGGPSPDNLLPVNWPPDDVGTPFTDWPRSRKKR